MLKNKIPKKERKQCLPKFGWGCQPNVKNVLFKKKSESPNFCNIYRYALYDYYMLHTFVCSQINVSASNYFVGNDPSWSNLSFFIKSFDTM